MQAIDMVRKRLKSNSKNSYKLILVDLNMPVKNGIETTLAIREICSKYNENPYIIGVSGDSGPEVENSCKLAGMNKTSIFLNFIKFTVTKPIEKDKMIKIIDELKTNHII